MRKKLIAAFLISSAVFGAVSNAAVVNKIDETDNEDSVSKTITVSGTVPIDQNRPSGREVIIRVYKKGSTNTDEIEYMAQTTADSDGNYSVSFKKASDSGDYKIEVNYAASSENPYQTVHNYLSPALFKEFFDKVNFVFENKNREDYDAPAELLGLLKDYTEQRVLNIEKLNEMLSEGADTSFAIKYMLSKDGFSDMDSLVGAFMEGYTLNKINESGENELKTFMEDGVFKEYISLDEALYKTYSGNICERVLKRVCERDYENISGFKNTFYDITLTEELSGKLWQSMKKILEDNNSVIGIDFSEYNKLSAEKQQAAMIGFAGKISSVTGTESCRSVFDASVAAAKAQPSGGNPSAGGGSGGGGGGAKVSGKNVSPSYTIDLTNRDYEKTNDEKTYFSDIKGYDWANEAINYLAKIGALSGDGSGSFRPGDFVTRAEFVKMVTDGTKMTDAGPADNKFTDVLAGSWYENYIRKAVGAGIINGVSETEFSPDENIVRADAAVIAMRVLKFFGQEFTVKNIAYKDVTENYAFDSIYQAAEAGIMRGTGDNMFEPKRNLTRAEAAVIVYNISKSKGDFVE